MRALHKRCKEGADIWSLGATLFALLTGRELGKSEELLDVLEASVKMLEKGALDDWDRKQFFAADSPALAAAERAAWAAAPAPLRGLIVDCLALAPEKRPTAVQLMARELLVVERAAVELADVGRADVERAAAERAEREHAVETAMAPLMAENRALQLKVQQLEERLACQPPVSLRGALGSLFSARTGAEKAWLVAGHGVDAFTRRGEVVAAEQLLEAARSKVLAERAAFKERYTLNKSKDAALLALDIAAAEQNMVAEGADLFISEYAKAFSVGAANVATCEQALAAEQARALQQRGEAVALLMGGGGGGGVGGGGGGGPLHSYDPVGGEALREGETVEEAVERHGKALASLLAKFDDRVKLAEKRGFYAEPTVAHANMSVTSIRVWTNCYGKPPPSNFLGIHQWYYGGFVEQRYLQQSACAVSPPPWFFGDLEE